jgi:cytochrome c peroxidase
VLKGKQFFYDALDDRLARDAYLSCASCHADAGTDGRTWDFTGFGEGLRRTVSLRGRAGGSRPLHWSGNFDETQDFEGQIRRFAGGRGLMTDADFEQRKDPLGAPKAGVSPDLDALSAYLASLDTQDPSPHRNADGSLTAQGLEGKSLFAGSGCLTCHGGEDFSGPTRHSTTWGPSNRRADSGWSPAHGHRHTDASRRLGVRHLPARRLGRQRSTGYRRPFVRQRSSRRRSQAALRLRHADREPGLTA